MQRLRFKELLLAFTVVFALQCCFPPALRAEDRYPVAELAGLGEKDGTEASDASPDLPWAFIPEQEPARVSLRPSPEGALRYRAVRIGDSALHTTGYQPSAP